MMKKIRVLQVCGGLSTEGIGVFLLNTMENINTDQFEITFALATKYKQSLESRIEDAGGKILRTAEIGDGIKGKMMHFINLLKVIKNTGPYDVVHTHMDFFNGINLLAAFIGGIKKRISHAHVAGKPNISIEEKLYYSVMKMLIKILSTEKLGCSKVANENINGSGDIIYNGIDLEKFMMIKNFPEDLSIDKEKKNLITIGRMELPKNPFFTLNIIRELAKIDHNFHFFWIGSGSMYDEVCQLAEEQDLSQYITFLSNRMDVDQILFHMDMFVLPSAYEGLGIVLVEAQVSNVECLTSTAVPQEVNIGLCNYLDLDKGEKYWANEILKILSTENLSYKKLDTERLKMFDVKYMVRNLEKIYAS